MQDTFLRIGSVVSNLAEKMPLLREKDIVHEPLYNIS